MNYEPLMEAIVEVVLFLELSDDAKIDEDAAVNLMEDIAASLQQLGIKEKNEFICYLQKRVQDSAIFPPKARDCLEGMAENLGINQQ